MKTYLKYTAISLVILMTSSCRNSEKRIPTSSQAPHILTEQQIYNTDTTGILIFWTAYKFSDKTGVSGTFNTSIYNPKNTTGNIETILTKSKLLIPTTSVNSGNAIRDFKLNTYFFKAFNTQELKATITKATENEGLIDLKMNGISKKIAFTYAIEKDTIILFTNLNLNYWKAEEALKILNTECYELHKGADGISKLWPEVDVVVKIPVQKSTL